MVESSGNVRCKNPRRVQAQFHAPARALHHAYRWGPSVTPTPAPVTVSVAPKEKTPSKTIEPVELTIPTRPLFPAFAVIMVMMCGLVSVAWAGSRLLGQTDAQAHHAATHLVGSLPEQAPQAPSKPAPIPIDIEHEGYLPLRGGVLITPRSFKPTDSRYDLVIHFHGNVSVVRKSIESVGINAALAVINLGERSKVYRQAYESPGAFDALLAQINRAVEQRGLKSPKLNRLALSAWSGGYTAIESALRSRLAREYPLDSIMLLDGLHCPFEFGNKNRLRINSMRGFIGAAHEAAEGGLMMMLTHTQIDPITYGSTKRTAEYLLKSVGAKVRPQAMLTLPDHVELPDLQGVASALRDRRLVPMTETKAGLLQVRGFKGNTKEDHAAHLLQMAATTLPALAARWAEKR